MSDYYPYLNRGAYRWIPDTYASTSEANFGVTEAYNFAVCNHGRHINMLAGEDARHAFGTTVICGGITDSRGNPIVPGIFYPGMPAPNSIKAPFQRKIRRGTSRNLINIPFPPVTEGIGMSYLGVTQGITPFFFFSTISLSQETTTRSSFRFASSLGSGRIASVDIEYMHATSEEWEKVHSATNPPLAILAVLDDSLIEENNLWWNTSRAIFSENEDKISTWGSIGQ